MTSGLNGLRVLVADDEPFVRRALRRLLVKAGCAVTEAATGIAARDVLSEQPFDLVITDYRMPEWTGGDLIRWIRSRWPSLLVVLYSGFPEEAGAVDADAILAKSVGPDALLDALMRLIASRSALEPTGLP
jgi:CheY-like chemotaxis protein